MPVRKAVIPAAGLGTRFLPASKSVPKVLIPVVDKPVIQYAVEEVVRAGVTSICIVTSRGSEAIADHFSPAPELEDALEELGKDDLLREVRAISDLADIYYVRQPQPLGLGHAVLMGRDHVHDEPFMVALPDEIMDPKNNFMQEMAQVYDEKGASVIAVVEVPEDEISSYGAVTTDDSGDVAAVTSIIEKPARETVNTRLAVRGRYVLDPEIFDILSKIEPGTGGEIQLTDALAVLAERGRLYAMKYSGRQWDAGQKEGYLEAVVALAAERDDLPGFRKFLASFRQDGSS